MFCDDTDDDDEIIESVCCFLGNVSGGWLWAYLDYKEPKLAREQFSYFMAHEWDSHTKVASASFHSTKLLFKKAIFTLCDCKMLFAPKQLHIFSCQSITQVF